MPRTESESTTSGFEDDDVALYPIWGVNSVEEDNSKESSTAKGYMTLRERRQIKLGLRKILPLNVLIPNSKITDKNRKWYEVLKKVWHHKDPWQVFHLDTLEEKLAMRHRYDPIKQRWCQDEIRIKMEDQPFNRGAMRQCFRLKKLSKFCHSDNWLHAGNYVAKKYMESVDRSVYFEDVKLQMDAKLWGEEYNRHNPPKKIDIFQMYVIELIHEPGSPLYHLEHFIEGEYIKYNSNSGFVEDSKQCRHTPQAFSHFTFERSGHEIIVVDIQGVGDLYTDPQIHTEDGIRYGDGNLGTKGMALFFQSHECNEICHALGLEGFDLSEAERQAIIEHHASTPSSATEIRDINLVGHVVSPTLEERTDLKRMLSNSRQRTLSSLSDLGSLPEDEMPKIEKQRCTDSSAPILAISPNGNNSDEGILIDKHLDEDSSDISSIHQPPRSRFLSTSSSDGYAYDTSEGCASSTPSNAASLTKLYEQRLFGLPTRSSRVQSEHVLRSKSCLHTGDSILGQIHHDLAKYHEIGRFACDGDESKIDWQSALFHEEHAAELGVPEAIITMAKIYLMLPHDVLVNCTVPANEENTNKGVEFMLQAAEANDRASMLYMAKAFETGYGLGTKREKSYKSAVHWYQTALLTTDHDDHGEFDATMSDPNYILLAAQAKLYLSGGFGLEKDPNKAGELYSEAADEAMAAMKGQLATKFYMKADEAWAQLDEGQE